MIVMKYIRVLPLLILVAFFSFAIRIGDFYSGLRQSGVAFAQEEVTDAQTPPLPAPEQADLAAGGPGTESIPVAEPGKPEVSGGEAVDPQIWKDAGDTTFEYSEVREELYKDLVKRREEIEKRERELSVREALLEAGEREVDQKLRELPALRSEIEALLKEQSEEEIRRIESLVKIYEGMKSKDAAVIFNTLDMDVLIQIMGRMSERKSAPIFAEMNPDRARTVTILLAQQMQLPELLPQ